MDRKDISGQDIPCYCLSERSQEKELAFRKRWSENSLTVAWPLLYGPLWLSTNLSIQFSPQGRWGQVFFLLTVFWFLSVSSFLFPFPGELVSCIKYTCQNHIFFSIFIFNTSSWAISTHERLISYVLFNFMSFLHSEVSLIWHLRILGTACSAGDLCTICDQF